MGVIRGLQALPPRTEPYELVRGDVVAEADVCIVGSGAAGAVLAKELVDAGLRVVVLERGGYYEGRDMNQREEDMMPLLWKNGGFNFDDSLRVAIAQGHALGGSTIINDAVCFDMPERVRAEWRRLGVGFTDAEWDEHARRVNRALSVTEVREDELNRNNQLLRQGAEALGLQEHRRNRRNCVNCMQCGFCHLGCHYDTKRNVLVTYLHEALKKPNLEVFVDCYVDRLEHEDGLVTGVRGAFCDPSGGEVHRLRVNARVVVVSAGAIASSKLLLRSGIATATAGRGLALHPAPFVLGDFEGEVKGNQGIPMAYTVHDFGVTRTSEAARRREGFREGEFLLESIYLPLLQFSMAIPSHALDHARFLQRYNHYAMAGVLVRDDPRGRVSLTLAGRASVRYDLGPKEAAIVAKGIELLGRMWFALGARRLVTSHRDMVEVRSPEELARLVAMVKANPERLALGSAHPQGGNPIGTRPETSVVDPDCRVHGFRNLFVCDASVFPTAVGVNPQVPVMTVASIVARRLAKAWAARYAALPVSQSLGDTGALEQPMYCDRATMGRLFDARGTALPATALVNAASEKPDGTNWAFDRATMTIRNDLHWRGLFPRDGDAASTLVLYSGGFWKRFGREGGEVRGTTHPYELPVYAPNVARDGRFAGKRCVVLDYTAPPYQDFHDVLKLVDRDTILGKAFFGEPRAGQEVLTFAMARRYPFGFMDEQDHELVYAQAAKPSLASMVGVWEGRLVSDSAWTGPLFRFRYRWEGAELKNDYVFGGSLTGTATVRDMGDHLRMDDVTGAFHDELRAVKPGLVVGKYHSETNALLRWLPEGLSFLHVDRTRPSVFLPYVLRYLGDERAFREYAD